MAKQEKIPGREYLDPKPIEWPVGVGVPESLEQKIARMVRTSVSDHARSHGAETFEEADDFDIEDPEQLPGSPHELDDDQERIMRDQEAVRRIPPQFRQAFERETARKAKEAEEMLRQAKPVENPTPAEVAAPPKSAESSPS